MGKECPSTNFKFTTLSSLRGYILWHFVLELRHRVVWRGDRIMRHRVMGGRGGGGGGGGGGGVLGCV